MQYKWGEKFRDTVIINSGISKVVDNYLPKTKSLSFRLPIFAPMKKIITHIETLLRRHDYVIVPELGGFVLQNQPAFVTSESIEPPLAVISFNPLMKISDGLLAIELSRAEQISFREAVQLINNEVVSAKSLLDNGKRLELGSMGSLTPNGDKKIIFTPADNSNFIPSNFGLATLHISAIPKSIVKERHILQIVLPSRRNMIKYAAAVAVVAGLVFVSPKLNDTSKDLAKFFPTEQLLNTFEKEVQDEQQSPLTPISIPIPQEVRQATPPPVSQLTELKHHVIVSCMTTEKDADELCAKLRMLNFDKAHVLPPIKTFRVAIESFAAKNEAVKFMEQLRISNPQFADAWVLSE